MSTNIHESDNVIVTRLSLGRVVGIGLQLCAIDPRKLTWHDIQVSRDQALQIHGAIEREWKHECMALRHEQMRQRFLEGDVDDAGGGR